MAAWKENRNCQHGKTKTDKICGGMSRLDSYAKEHNSLERMAMKSFKS